MDAERAGSAATLGDATDHFLTATEAPGTPSKRRCSKAKGATAVAVSKARGLVDPLRCYVAELIGTFLMVYFGIFAVSSGAIAGALVGLGQVAAVWSVGVALSIYATAQHSGAHLNPAITLSLAVWQDFPWRRVPGYILAQLAASILAGFLNLAIYGPFLDVKNELDGFDRGDEGSRRTAMAFGEYFPNPALDHPPAISSGAAFAAEALGTAILAFLVASLTDPANHAVPKGAAPLLIGATVGALISTLAPVSQAGFNPARDFGPRLAALAGGWAGVAFEGWWVYVVGPVLGAQVGMGLHSWLMRGGDASKCWC